MNCALSANHKPCCHERSREQGGLAVFQLIFVPKATFLKILCSMQGRNSCHPAKKCRKEKPHGLLHCLGRSHGGIPAGLTVTQAESRLRKSLSFRDTLQFLSQTAETVCTLRQAAANTGVSVSVIYPGTCLPGYERAVLQHADLSVKPEAFVLHICVC